MNYIYENERRVIDLGREKGERRAKLKIANENLATAKQNYKNALLGLLTALIFAAVILAPWLSE